MRVAPSIMRFLLLLFSIWAPTVASPEPASEPLPPIAVRLYSAKATYRVGEAVTLRVEIVNQGLETLFIYGMVETVSGSISDLEVEVKDGRGRISPQERMGPPFVLFKPDQDQVGLESVLWQSWIALRPGYSYGTTVEIDGDSHEFLRQPGRYRITATYSSWGMEAPVYYSPLAKHPEEVAKLPFKSWKGSVRSNPIWIVIRPSGVKRTR